MWMAVLRRLIVKTPIQGKLVARREFRLILDDYDFILVK